MLPDRPETTLLYQIIREYWPEFQLEMTSQDKHFPVYITLEFEVYLKCRRLEHGFLRIRCETCHDEKLVAAVQFVFHTKPELPFHSFEILK